MRTKLIRNLLRRKFVLYDERDRKDRSMWLRVLKKEVAGDSLFVLAKNRHGDHVVLVWLLEWNNRFFIPEDAWTSASAKSGLRLFRNMVGRFQPCRDCGWGPCDCLKPYKDPRFPNYTLA